MKKNQESFNTITKWSKNSQKNIISDIVSQYPTAKQFKAAILKNGDPKSVEIVENLDPNIPRDQYIDFLQYVFVKHSNVGNILASSLVGLGVGGLIAYLSNKEAQDRFVKKHEADVVDGKYDILKNEIIAPTEDEFKKSKMGKLAKDVYDLTQHSTLKGSGIDKIGDDAKIFAKDVLNSKMNLGDKLKSGWNLVDKVRSTKYNLDQVKNNFNSSNDGVDDVLQLAGNVVGVGRKASDILQDRQNAKNMGKGVGALAGLAGGTATGMTTNSILNWRDKKAQNKINALKYQQ